MLRAVREDVKSATSQELHRFFRAGRGTGPPRKTELIPAKWTADSKRPHLLRQKRRLPRKDEIFHGKHETFPREVACANGKRHFTPEKMKFSMGNTKLFLVKWHVPMENDTLGGEKSRFPWETALFAAGSLVFHGKRRYLRREVSFSMGNGALGG